MTVQNRKEGHLWYYLFSEDLNLNIYQWYLYKEIGYKFSRLVVFYVVDMLLL